MNISSKFLLSIALIFSVFVTESTLLIATPELDQAFVEAVKRYDIEEMKELIEAGADVDVLISYPYTFGTGEGCFDTDLETSPLIFAVRKKRPEMVRVLAQKSKDDLCKALEIAIDLACPLVVSELLAAGADVSDGKLLMYAVGRAGPIGKDSFNSIQVVKVILNAGASIKYADECGRTALMRAIEEYDLSTVQSLLKNPEMTRGWFLGFGQKPINYVDKDGNTALVIAVKNIRTSYWSTDKYGRVMCNNSQKIVEELLNTPGIDLDRANKDGETARALLAKLNNR